MGVNRYLKYHIRFANCVLKKVFKFALTAFKKPTCEKHLDKNLRSFLNSNQIKS